MASSQINHRFLHITKKTSNDTAFLISGRGTLTHKHGAKRSFGFFEVEPRELYMGDNARISSIFNVPKQLITLRNRSLLPCSVDMVPNTNQRVRAAFKAGNEYNKRKVAPGMTISIEVSVKSPGVKKRTNNGAGVEDLRYEPLKGTAEDPDNVVEEEEEDVFNDGDYEAYMKPELLDTICIRAGRQVFAVPIYAGSAPLAVQDRVEQKEDFPRNMEERPETAAAHTNTPIGSIETHQLPYMHGTLFDSNTNTMEWRIDRVQYKLHPELGFSQAIRKEQERHQQHAATQFPRHFVDIHNVRAQVAVAPVESTNPFTKHKKKKKVVRIHPDVLHVLKLKETRARVRREEQVLMGMVSAKSQRKLQAVVNLENRSLQSDLRGSCSCDL